MRQDGGFEGFATSGLATAVPNAFFTEVIPYIREPEQLVVSIYFFYAQQHPPPRADGRRGWPRYLSQEELAADRTLLRALSNFHPGRELEALDRGLELAVEQETLFRADTPGGRHLYSLNTPANRRALQALLQHGLSPDEGPPPADVSTLPNIFALYETNVGAITPLIADQLKEAEERYPKEWVSRAFREAAELNKRNWRYIERILRRWEIEGPDYEERERGSEADWLAKRYASGKRRPNRTRHR